MFGREDEETLGERKETLGERKETLGERKETLGAKPPNPRWGPVPRPLLFLGKVKLYKLENKKIKSFYVTL